MQEIKGHDLIIPLGNSAAGKSTILMSLAHGPNALQEREFIEEITLNHGGSRQIKKKCIDINELFLADHNFEIGH